MTAKSQKASTKNRRPPKPRGRPGLDARLMPYVRDLARTTHISKDVAMLTRALLATAAWHASNLSDEDTLIGVTGAALLASYAFNRDPGELCAWLRGTADSLERARPK